MPEITKKDLIAMRNKLEKCKIPKDKNGNYIIKLYKPDEATIKLIKELEGFELKEES